MDQATTLRQIVGRHHDEDSARRRGREGLRVISITSGKGGVGKTNLVLGLSMALARRERRVFLVDADMGLANVDVLLGLTPRYTLEHVMNGQKTVDDVVVMGPLGVKILPSSSGISELSEMSFEQQMALFRALSGIDDQVDYLFIDTGAGISSNVLRFNASANEVVVVASPEPTSITDAYALIKLLAIKYHMRDFALIANSVASEEDGRSVFERLNSVCNQFLNVSLDFLGSVPYDTAVRKAVRQQRALFDLYPTAPASKSLARIAQRMDERGRRPLPAEAGQAPASFWDRLLHWKKVK